MSSRCIVPVCLIRHCPLECAFVRGEVALTLRNQFQTVTYSDQIRGRWARLLLLGPGASSSTTTMTDESKQKSESEWRAILPPEQFRVLRQKGTERPGTGEYEHHMEQGVYSCAGCGTQLYQSSTKFLSGCGWPAFLDGTAFIISPSISVLNTQCI